MRQLDFTQAATARGLVARTTSAWAAVEMSCWVSNQLAEFLGPQAPAADFRAGVPY